LEHYFEIVGMGTRQVSRKKKKDNELEGGAMQKWGLGKSSWYGGKKRGGNAEKTIRVER